MSLNLSPIYEDMVRQFQTLTTDDRFRDDFVSACNKTLDELFIAGDLDSAITHINAPTDSISELNSDDMFIVSSGCVYYLIISGRNHVLKENAFQVAKNEWEERKGDFMIKQSRTDQADVEDNLTGIGASIIGLGDVTDQTLA